MLIFISNLPKVAHDNIELPDSAESMGKLNSIFVIMLRFLRLSEIFPKVFLSPYLSSSYLP